MNAYIFPNAWTRENFIRRGFYEGSIVSYNRASYRFVNQLCNDNYCFVIGNENDLYRLRGLEFKRVLVAESCDMNWGPKFSKNAKAALWAAFKSDITEIEVI